jgi:hypothetical protein
LGGCSEDWVSKGEKGSAKAVEDMVAELDWCNIKKGNTKQKSILFYEKYRLKKGRQNYFIFEQTC